MTLAEILDTLQTGAPFGLREAFVQQLDGGEPSAEFPRDVCCADGCHRKPVLTYSARGGAEPGGWRGEPRDRPLCDEHLGELCKWQEQLAVALREVAS